MVYDIFGGAIFIEDGIETNNIIQYNLAVFVRQSTSLLNDDITPGDFCLSISFPFSKANSLKMAIAVTHCLNFIYTLI